MIPGLGEHFSLPSIHPAESKVHDGLSFERDTLLKAYLHSLLLILCSSSVFSPTDFVQACAASSDTHIILHHKLQRSDSKLAILEPRSPEIPSPETVKHQIRPKTSPLSR